MGKFEINRRAEEQFGTDILRLLSYVFKEGADAANVLLLTSAEWLTSWSKQIAERMVTQQMVSNNNGWRAAARESGRGPLLRMMLERELRGRIGDRYRELVEQNASLISSLPLKVATAATARIAQLERAGERAKVVAKEDVLRGLSRSHALLVARTEIAKANAALTQARAEDLGLHWYVWRTSRDTRVRASHRFLRDVLVAYSNPPSPEELLHLSSYGHYHAGDIFNCRCYQDPLLTLTQVSWPHRVYWANHVIRMTLTDFRRLNQSQFPFAAREAA